ncbi:hypothetical protein TK90_2700 (plasmid) [Thioalkalivibrio sp. K90mix]|uniref:hypothetical protein n=1 Tax=Thioalkalivibrio sp. (strain K90mix) TaxID=396595 RepID=UPI000195A44D|nr:hypothetical protein [Thioalkalivibrio sp. K90mix]ADC73186.1 hypothetical protein TK90_2700 [Thioalkalivibrio sp. K90mix]
MYFAHTVLWPGKPPAAYRRILASLVPDEGEFQIPPEIFHYGPDGKPLQGLSPFRFSSKSGDGDQTQLVLSAIGPQAVAMLRRETWKITHLLSESKGHPLADRTHTGYCELRVAPRPETFLVNHMIAERHQRERGASSDPEVIRRKILAGLEAQCALLGRPLPEGVEEAIYDIRPSEKTFATPIAGGMVGVGPHEIEMDAALEIKGPWHVGSLAARGFGRILQPRRAQDRKVAA